MSRWHNIYLDNVAYFFTSTIVENIPVLHPNWAKKLIIDVLNFYREKCLTRINAYAIMPEHIHLIIKSESKENTKRFIQHTLRKISQMIILHTKSLLADDLQKEAALEILNVFRDHARGKATHRVWKERAKGIPIYSDKVMKQKLDYIHQNPVKRGLVQNPEDYLYSSFRNYYFNDHKIIKIDFVDVMKL
jgi:REP element-mobilizing transposase RayT